MSDKKGKPTPKRKEAQAKLKVSSLSPAASKEAKKALKAQARVRRLETRAAYMRGEESALPVKDKGPARRFVRNYVDERKSVTEYFLIFIMFILFLTVIPSPAVQLGAIVLMYSAMIWVAIDGFLLSRRVKKLVAEKFPDQPTKGLGLYGWMRSTQLRRLRAPAPQVGPSKKK
ncbi:MAG: DUF3043 domain-containing protein [Actinobacteria bacterium]|nr:DUF3043 domain-containing protein [Actinomycetota bacterium]